MFECVQICTVSDTLPTLQRPAAIPIVPAWPVWYWVQRVQRPGVCVVPCMVCPAACRVQSFRVRWCGQGCTGGVYSRRPAPPGQSFNHRKNKKGSKKLPYPLLPISKIPPQKQKDPYKGSAFCAILALQALKGRNLQWLKVK